MNARTSLVGGTAGQIQEFDVTTGLECARLCHAEPYCSDVNVISKTPTGGFRCQIIMAGGTGQAANVTAHARAYAIKRDYLG